MGFLIGALGALEYVVWLGYGDLERERERELGRWIAELRKCVLATVLSILFQLPPRPRHGQPSGSHRSLGAYAYEVGLGFLVGLLALGTECGDRGRWVGA